MLLAHMQRLRAIASATKEEGGVLALSSHVPPQGSSDSTKAAIKDNQLTAERLEMALFAAAHQHSASRDLRGKQDVKGSESVGVNKRKKTEHSDKLEGGAAAGQVRTTKPRKAKRE